MGVAWGMSPPGRSVLDRRGSAAFRLHPRGGLPMFGAEPGITNSNQSSMKPTWTKNFTRRDLLTTASAASAFAFNYASSRVWGAN